MAGMWNPRRVERELLECKVELDLWGLPGKEVWFILRAMGIQ